MRRPAGGLTGAAERVGAGDVEVAQGHVPQPVRGPCIAQHDLGHELGGTVGRRRHRAIVLPHRRALGIAVDRGGRGEDEMAHPVLDRGFDQGARIRGIVAVIAERIAHRVRHDDRGGEMDDGVDPVLRDQRAHARLIAGIANHERRTRRHRPIEAGGEIVEHHHALAGIDQRVNHVASDIAGAAGHQGRHAAQCLAQRRRWGRVRSCVTSPVVTLLEFALVWRFRSPHHSCGEFEMRTSEPKPH